MHLSPLLSFAALILSVLRTTFAAPDPNPPFAAAQSMNLVRRSVPRPVDLGAWAQAQQNRLKNKYGIHNHQTKRSTGMISCVTVSRFCD